MRVSDIMTRSPFTVSPCTKADEVARLMLEKGISRDTLVKNGKPIGIVTERDLVHRILAPEKTRIQ